MNDTPYSNIFEAFAELTEQLLGITGQSKPASPIVRVVFHEPATIIFWTDGTKTVVKAQNNEPFDPEKGIAMAIAKRALGNTGSYFDHIRKWSDKYDMRRNITE